MTDNALAIIEEKNVATYFNPQGLDPIIEAIRKEVLSIVSDISTEQGRAEIRSRAFKLAKTKTALDEIGKKLTEDTKKQIKAVDAERSRAWDALEALQKEVRQPLTDWENAEKTRVADHEAALAAIPEHPSFGQHENAADIAARLTHLENLPPREWQEFQARAAHVITNEINRTKELLATAQKREADAAELARLQKVESDRKQRENEERIRAEAAEKARLEAEAIAKAAADKAEADRLEAERKAKEQAEALAAQVKAEADAAAAREAKALREASEADERARKAEADRLAAIAQAEADKEAAAEQAEKDRIAAAEKAKRDADAAAQRERDRIEGEKKAEAAATAAREADKKHRAKINNEVLNALIEQCNSETVDVTPDIAKAVIGAIAKGLIPHVKISY